MTSGYKTRNPLVLFEGNSNFSSKPLPRNPITQGDYQVQPSYTPKNPMARNPILQNDINPIRQSLNVINKQLPRNPIVSDNNEHVKVRDTNTYKDSNIFGPGEADIRPSTGKGKHNPTYSSTLFHGPKAEPTNRKKLVTDLSTDQLFGDYKEPPVRKPQKKDYKPNFLDISPEQRRYLEVFGNEKPPNPAKEVVLEKSERFVEKDPFSKKINNLESNIFYEEDKKRPQTTKAQKPKEKFFAKTQWDSQMNNQTVDNQRRDADGNYAFSKKQEEFQKSNIFGQSRENVVVSKQTEFQDDSNKDKRKQMRNYSDLFNLPQYENPNPNFANEKKKQDNDKIVEENYDPHAKRLKDLYSSVLANDDLMKNYQDTINSSQINANRPTDNHFEAKNARDLKQMNLQSNLLGNEGGQENFDNIKNPVFYDFDVNGVSQDFDPGQLQKFCANKGYHLVEFKANTNSLNTSNNGTGRLKIRIADEQSLNDVKSKLGELGMDVNDHTETHVLKHNYIGVAGLDWKDANLAGQEKRLHGNDFVDAKEQKMRDLESNGDVFGNSKGVGKWDKEWIENNKNKKASETHYTPEDNVQTLNWKKSMKNLEKVKNPMYKAGTSFQNQKLFTSSSSKMFAKK